MYNIALKLAVILNHALDNKYPLNKLRYGIELIITQSILLISMTIFSVLSGTLVELFCFLIPLVLIRTFSGGFHSKTFSECFIITNSVCFTSIYLSETIDNNLFYTLISISSYIIICLCSPITSKKMSIEKIKFNKLYAILFSSFFTLFVLFNNVLKLKLINIFSYVLFAVAISLLVSLRSEIK